MRSELEKEIVGGGRITYLFRAAERHSGTGRRVSCVNLDEELMVSFFVEEYA